MNATTMNATKSSRRFALTLSGATALLVLLVFSVFWASPVSAQETNGENFVNGEVVVKLNKTTGTTIEDVYAAYPEVDRTRTETFLASSGIHLLRLQGGSDTADVAGRMKNDTTRLVYAEPNYTTDAPEDSRHMRARGDNAPAPSSDPGSYSNQYAVGALNLPEAHRVNEGAGATVAVLDTGVQRDHPVLAGGLVEGYDFIGDDADPSDETNGIDDDGDGNKDEATGHGMHVAGIVHLTAPDAKIMPLRVLDSDGRGNVFVIAEAVQYAVNNGADVINMSLGSSQESQMLNDVIEDLEGDDDQDALENVPEEGVVVVASAGNDNTDEPHYPAAGEEAGGEGVIAVASVNDAEQRSDFSNFGPWVDVAAPGDDIHSLFPTDQYAEWDGTSMAAPFVAGQAALIRSLRPTLLAAGPDDPATPGPDSVESAIGRNARSLDAKNPEYAGKLGAGHADACASVKDLRPDTTCDAATEPPSNTEPSISAVRPTPGSATRDRTPLIVASVGDAETDLTEGVMSLSLDGRPKIDFSYDAGDSDRLIYRSGKLSYGFHTVRISAKDPEGLPANKAWRFKVRR